jgi:thiamine-monophosphate kinase
VTSTTPLREDDVVAAIRTIVERPGSSKVLLGIGDDAAVWQPSRSHRSVVTTDMLVEDVHFSRATMPVRAIGWRAMAANCSDVAAMGARGVLATIALGLPPAWTVDETEELYRGLAACADASRVIIAGGDLSRGPVLTISITVVGEVRPSNLKLRSGGRRGDIVAVTGALGASRAGLDIMNARATIDDALRNEALAAHRTPVPRVREGGWLGASRNVHAMMDCSDGLSTDLARLCAASGCGAIVEAVPVAASARAVAEQLGEEPQQYALAGGEDFELLVAVAPRAYEHVALRFHASFKRLLQRVGVLQADESLVVRKEAGLEPLARSGWDHFA